MEEPINRSRIPDNDSIKELAEFWDTHDLTDFQDELEEVKETIFQHWTTLNVRLEAAEADAVERIADTRGISCQQLLREWILEGVRKG